MVTNVSVITDAIAAPFWLNTGIKIAFKIILQILPVTTHRKNFFHYQLLKEADQIHHLKEAS
ncbi:hypothetical protein CU012_1648 [Enterococcus faecium]|uniref:Uncharacterized protein n=1 Tax=Enterococcus faecium (strain ATCC BAA-472 / TX0016 / DO) TaxID=333849 RepID=I3U3G1_ENTFD|nr:hypothetical protein HMPREF0351_11925 [Enterococcus faecium DO]MBK4867067.1 hypothetical protein [Enterococcus faecium]